MSIEQTVVCDGCAAILAARKNAWQARADARHHGAVQRGSKDYCARCKDKPR